MLAAVTGRRRFLQTIVRARSILAFPILAFPVLALMLSGCGAPQPADFAEARQHYLTAKADCDRAYPHSLAALADCRSHAANVYIRPYYRYGDLMDYAQSQRKMLALEADRHEISRASYDHRIALSERVVSREEDRRNRLAHTNSSYQSTPFTPVVATLSRIFN